MTNQQEKIEWLVGLPQECSELDILLKNGSKIQISPAWIRHDMHFLHIVPQKYVAKTDRCLLTTSICEVKIGDISFISLKDSFGKTKVFIR